MRGLSGTLDRLHMGDLFEWLHLTHATGRLSLSSGAVTRTFDIHQGKVAFASSSHAGERLASWLLRKELLPRQVLLRSLAISLTRGELLTAVLERETGLTHAALTEAGRGLATALASRVLREPQVTFSFDPTWPVAKYLHIDLAVECRNLVMQAAYRVDTVPPAGQDASQPLYTLEPDTMEMLFWRVADQLEGELVEVSVLAEAHRTFLAVGALLHRWITQGPPLLPIGPDDVLRARARLAAGELVELEDSPTLAWNLLALVNGLDAPGCSRACSAREAQLMAGGEASTIVGLLLDASRWRREARGEGDATVRRAALARVAAARVLAAQVGLSEDFAATAAALPVVLLELVATALATTPLASPAMQRCALHHLLPVVGQAAGAAAGLPEGLLAATTLSPPSHAAARLSRLVGMAVGELGSPCGPQEAPIVLNDPALASAIANARAAAAELTGL